MKDLVPNSSSYHEIQISEKSNSEIFLQRNATLKLYSVDRLRRKCLSLTQLASGRELNHFDVLHQNGNHRKYRSLPVSCLKRRNGHTASRSIKMLYEEEEDQVPSNNSDLEYFPNKLQTMLKWFQEFNDEQKNRLLQELLIECSTPQTHLLSIHMETRRHQNCPPNCCDMISWLPSNVASIICSYLDPVSLSRCCGVCRKWREIVSDELLWKNLSLCSQWKLSETYHSKLIKKCLDECGRIEWKRIFAQQYRLRMNWVRGHCTVRTFEGHSQMISCVQFDDTRIVSGSSDKSIKVWNIKTNSPWSVLTLLGHSGTVRCLHLQGDRLVSGSSDTTIKVWHVSGSKNWSSINCKMTLLGHSDTVRCLQSEGDLVVSGSYDCTLKVWSIAKGTCLKTLRGHDGPVLCLQFDSAKIISGSADRTIKIWSFEGDCLKTLFGHQDAITCIHFNGWRIVSGSLDRNIKFWNLDTGECINTIDWATGEGHTGVIRCIQADSWKIVSAADDKTIKIWNMETGERLATLRDHTDGVTCLQFNDTKLVSGSYDKSVKLWDFSVC